MRFVLALLAAFAVASPAYSDQILGPGRIDGASRVILPGGPTLGTWQNGKYTARPDTLVAPQGAILPGRYWAKAYGSCAWTLAGDVGPCVNMAITAAAAAGGGTVVVDGGLYGLATPIVNTTSGVRLEGAGVGDPRGTVNPYAFQATTRLIWRGAAGATMLSVGPAAGASLSLHDAGVTGIVLDCDNIADVGTKITQVSHSEFKLGAAEPVKVGIWTTTLSISDSPGTQDNDFWLSARITSSSSTATGILLDGNTSSCSGQAGTCWNTSYNRFQKLAVWRAGLGDGIVFGDSDNNVVTDLGVFSLQPSAHEVIFAAADYVMPNGMTVGGKSYTNRVLHTGAHVTVGGTEIALEFVDKANSVADPTFLPGATGSWSTSADPQPVHVGLQGRAWTTYTPALEITGGSGVSATVLDAAYQLTGRTLRLRFTILLDTPSASAQPSGVNVGLPAGLALKGAQSGAAFDVGTGVAAQLAGNSTSKLSLYRSGSGLAGGYLSGSFAGEVQ